MFSLPPCSALTQIFGLAGMWCLVLSLRNVLTGNLNFRINLSFWKPSRKLSAWFLAFCALPKASQKDNLRIIVDGLSYNFWLDLISYTLMFLHILGEKILYFETFSGETECFAAVQYLTWILRSNIAIEQFCFSFPLQWDFFEYFPITKESSEQFLSVGNYLMMFLTFVASVCKAQFGLCVEYVKVYLLTHKNGTAFERYIKI